MYDLGLYVGLFEILYDFIRLPGLYGLKYDGLITSVIAIVLVLLQIGRFYDSWHRSKDSTLNLSYVYLNTKILFYKNLKCASGHLLYAQLRTFRWLFKY